MSMFLFFGIEKRFLSLIRFLFHSHLLILPTRHLLWLMTLKSYWQ